MPVHVCVFALSGGATSVAGFLYKIKSPKLFAMSSINWPPAGATLIVRF